MNTELFVDGMLEGEEGMQEDGPDWLMGKRPRMPSEIPECTPSLTHYFNEEVSNALAILVKHGVDEEKAKTIAHEIIKENWLGWEPLE